MQEGHETNKRRRRTREVKLVIDLSWPDQCRIGKDLVKLQPKQWNLLVLLASHPRRYCPYEVINDTLWGDTVVDVNQKHYQKRKLTQALKKADTGAGQWVKTIPRRGFVLDLDPMCVLIKHGH